MEEIAFPYLNISIEESTNLLYSTWLRKPEHDEYQEGMNYLANCLERFPIFFWIQESTHLLQVPLENQREALHQIAETVMYSRVKKIARIISLDFANMTMFDEVVAEKMSKMEENQMLADRKIEVQQFNTYEEAADWIADIKV